MKKQQFNQSDIAGLCKKSDESIMKLVKAYKDPLYYFVLQLLQNDADAQEVTQDTFLKVLEKIETLQDYKAFNRWIYRIAYNKAMDVHRKTKILLPYEDEFYRDERAEDKNSPITHMERNEFIQEVKQDILKLSKPLREVAFLRYFEDFNVSEISKILDIKEGTVKSRLKTIREQLQPKLKKKGYSPTKVASFSLSPIAFNAYQEILQSIHEATTSYEVVAQNIQDATKVALTSNGSFAFVKSLLHVNVVSALAIGAVTTATLVAYNQSLSKDLFIEHIVYHQEPTNQTLEVAAQYNKNIKDLSIEVTNNQDVLDYTIKDNEVIFYASKNGEYIITVENNTKTIQINNIDQEPVQANAFTYEDGILNYKLKDDASGVDYAKSYMIYQGNRYPIHEDGILKQDLLGDLTFYLFDKVGNASQYVYKIGTVN